MKKILSLILFTILCVSALSACNETSQEETSTDTKDTEYVVSEYDNESIIQADSSTTDEASAENENFIVKDKKYTFEGTDLILLNVKNKTSKNYSVTVTGTYLDKDGKVLKTETQTFDQSAAGYENFFLFNPMIVFDKFTYMLEVNETDAVMYAPNLEASLAEIYEKDIPVEEMIQQGNYNLFPGIVASFEYKKNSDEVLDIRSQWLLFNETDELIAIVPLGTYLWDEIEWQQWNLYYTTEETLEWPEEFQGNIRAVHILKSLVKGELS